LEGKKNEQKFNRERNNSAETQVDKKKGKAREME
jgi:hypothetical protein